MPSWRKGPGGTRLETTGDAHVQGRSDRSRSAIRRRRHVGRRPRGFIGNGRLVDVPNCDARECCGERSHHRRKGREAKRQPFRWPTRTVTPGGGAVPDPAGCRRRTAGPRRGHDAEGVPDPTRSPTPPRAISDRARARLVERRLRQSASVTRSRWYRPQGRPTRSKGPSTIAQQQHAHDPSIVNNGTEAARLARVTQVAAAIHRVTRAFESRSNTARAPGGAAAADMPRPRAPGRSTPQEQSADGQRADQCGKQATVTRGGTSFHEQHFQVVRRARRR